MTIIKETASSNSGQEYAAGQSLRPVIREKIERFLIQIV